VGSVKEGRREVCNRTPASLDRISMSLLSAMSSGGAGLLLAILLEKGFLSGLPALLAGRVGR